MHEAVVCAFFCHDGRCLKKASERRRSGQAPAHVILSSACPVLCEPMPWSLSVGGVWDDSSLEERLAVGWVGPLTGLARRGWQQGRQVLGQDWRGGRQQDKKYASVLESSEHATKAEGPCRPRAKPGEAVDRQKISVEYLGIGGPQLRIFGSVTHATVQCRAAAPSSRSWICEPCSMVGTASDLGGEERAF